MNMNHIKKYITTTWLCAIQKVIYKSYNSCKTKVISENNKKMKNKLIKITTARVIKQSLNEILFQVSVPV